MAQCRECAGDWAKFPQPCFLTRLFKEIAPLQVWAIDLDIRMPLGSSGETILVVTVCLYSKFVVMHPLPDKSVVTLARWFYKHIVCEYGIPRWVHTDKGGEF